MAHALCISINVSSAEQPLALPLEGTTSEEFISPGLTQTLDKGASLPLRVLGELNDAIMTSDLDIPHNRVRLDGGVLAKDEITPDFVKQMAHELRTPLNVIIGLCQYLERDREAPLNEKQQDTVTRMERNAHALLESVNRLLDSMRNGKSR